jgi:hypothetical protein
MPGARSVVDPAVLALIQREALAALPAPAAAAIHLSVDRAVVPAGHVYRLVDRQIDVVDDSVLVFVDEMPGANWAHPCFYQFHDPANGALRRRVPALFPPRVGDRHALVEPFHAPLARPTPPRPQVARRVDWRTRHGVARLGPRGHEQRYAVLWASQIANRRHVEDLEFLYRTLVDVYGFEERNIYALCFDGTLASIDEPDGKVGPWWGDETPYRMKVHAAATADALRAVFRELAARLAPDDLVVIHTNNHGHPDGLCVDNQSVIRPAELGALLAGLPRHHAMMVMMEQCYAGAFRADVLGRSTATLTSFAAAAPANKVSAADNHFDPVARLWIEAMHGATVAGAELPSDPDGDRDGAVSAWEAFRYATENDTTFDDPQFDDAPKGAGTKITLGRP